MNKLTVEEIQKIATDAEDMIASIIIRAEEMTGLACQDIGMYLEENENEPDKLKVDLVLRIHHRVYRDSMKKE